MFSNEIKNSISQFELGIALLPSSEVQQEAKRLNQIIKKKLPEIKNRDNIFHLSLFQGRFDFSDLDELKKTLDKIAAEVSPFEFILEKELENTGINIFWNAKKNSLLQSLHESTVKKFSQYRKGMPEQFLNAYESFSPSKKQQLDLYGVPGIMDEFKPHIAVFYRSDNEPRIDNILKLLKPKTNSLYFKPIQLVLGKLGYDGNIVEIIYQIPLK